MREELETEEYSEAVFKTPVFVGKVRRDALLECRMPLFGAALLLFVMTMALAALNLVRSGIGWDMPLWISAAYEIVFLLLPSMLVLTFSNAALPKRRQEAGRVFTVIGIAVTGLFIAGTLTSGWTLVWTFLTSGSYAPEISNVYADASYFELVVIVAYIPAICEELFFRGILMKSMSKNPALAIVISSALFALMHMDMSKLFATFALGLFIGWVVMRSGNVFLGMIIHFINNLFAVTVLYLTTHYYDAITYYSQHPEFLPSDVSRYIGQAGLLLMLLLPLSLIVFILLLNRFRRSTRNETGELHLAALKASDMDRSAGRTTSFGTELLLVASAMEALAVALLQTGLIVR